MIGRIGVALLFATLAFAHGHEERSLTVNSLPAVDTEGYNGKYVNVNKIFDQLHPYLHDFLLKLNMDPLELVDFAEPIIKLPGKLGSKMYFRHGFMHGMPCVRRTQDVRVKYEDKVLSLDMDLGWNKLDFNYQYSYDHLLIHRSGHVFGLVKNVDVNLRVEANFNTYRLSIESMKFMRVGDLKLTMGDNVGDEFLNIIIEAVTKVFREQVLKRLQERTLEIFRRVLDKFNSQIPKPERMRLMENFDQLEFRKALLRVAANELRPY